jgi:hypothetical protein
MTHLLIPIEDVQDCSDAKLIETIRTARKIDLSDKMIKENAKNHSVNDFIWSNASYEKALTEFRDGSL